MTAALFGLSESTLRTMDGSEIRVLFDNIAVAKSDWFRSLSPCIEGLSWEQFVRGWIHATAGRKSILCVYFPVYVC